MSEPCEQCETKSYDSIFKQRRSQADAAFTMKRVCDRYLAEGWEHGANIAGMIKRCEAHKTGPVTDGK